ncbi:hypothetical protein TNCV_3008551 [Trichonephila clavipes]|nr:hypothetical protein TNCV_3008551 [Trichonephila clavipes]
MHAGSVDSSNVLPLVWCGSLKRWCQLRGHGSIEVKVMDSWWACHEFEPSTAEDPPCRMQLMHIKYAEAQTSSHWCGGEVAEKSAGGRRDESIAREELMAREKKRHLRHFYRWTVKAALTVERTAGPLYSCAYLYFSQCRLLFLQEKKKNSLGQVTKATPELVLPTPNNTKSMGGFGAGFILHGSLQWHKARTYDTPAKSSTWRNLGGRVKLVSFLVTKLVTLPTILASLPTMLASWGPSGIFWKVVDLSTNDTSGYISGSFCRAYKKMLAGTAMSLD